MYVVVLLFVEPRLSYTSGPTTRWTVYPPMLCPNVFDGACHESLIWLGEIAVASNPLGTVVSAGFTDELEEGVLSL